MEVEFRPDVRKWYESLDSRTRARVRKKIQYLEQIGPELGRPHADHVKAPHVKKMKELRPTETIRIFFAGDSNGTAVLLYAGDKRGKSSKAWYRRMIERAEREYAEHERKLGKEPEWHRTTARAGSRSTPRTR